MKELSKIVALAILAAALPALTACGNKGPLVLAQKSVPVEAVAPVEQPPAGDATEGTPPAEIEPPAGAAPPSSTEPPTGDGDGTP